MSGRVCWIFCIFTFFYFDLLWWTRCVCSCLHSPSPPLMLGQLCSSAFPSPQHLPAASQCEHDNCLTKLGFINNPCKQFLDWSQALFTLRDQAGLCAFQPHIWPVLCGWRWPGTHCGQENGIPACYLVHDLPTCCAMQPLPLMQLIQTQSFSNVQMSSGDCKQENKSFKCYCQYICSCYPGYQIQTQATLQRTQKLEPGF